MSLEKTIAEAVTAAVMAELGPILERGRAGGLMTEAAAAAAEILGVSKRSMGRYREDGLVGYNPTGSGWYYYQRDIDNFVKRKGRNVV